MEAQEEHHRQIQVVHVPEELEALSPEIVQAEAHHNKHTGHGDKAENVQPKQNLLFIAAASIVTT